MEEEVRPLLADELRRHVEVVVVEHHDRLLLVLDLLEHRAREVLVHRAVALLVRLHLVLADVRRVREVPQVVLDEPQHRVRDHVVEAVVGVLVARDQPDPVGLAVHLDGERAAVVALRHLGVLVGHRRRHPDRVAVMHQALKRGHEPAAAALRLAPLERGRAAVRDEDEGCVLVHRCSRKSFSQSRRRRGVRKCVRTCSLPARPSRLPRSGSRRISVAAVGALVGSSTRGSRSRRPAPEAGCRPRRRR